MIKGVCVPDIEQPNKRCPVNSKKINGKCVCKRSHVMVRGFCVPKSPGRSKVSTKAVTLKTKANYAGVIQSAFRKTKHTLRSEYLKRHCPESSECLILGQKRDEILQLFNGFKNFDYSDKILTPIGKKSLNGVVHEIKFKHRNYTSYAVLKTSKEIDSDNLIYEYLMGLFINKINAFLPNFLETYGIFQCSPSFHTKLLTREPVKINDSDIIPLNIDHEEALKRGCVGPLYNQILIQHVKNAEPLYNKLSDNHFLKHHIMNVLFQTFASMYFLRGKFTHFDLHFNNILLQKPFENGVMEFHYDDAVIYSPYIVKIIDYGRAECSITDIILKELCQIPECNPGCGKNMGYKSVKKGMDNTSDVKILKKMGEFLPKRYQDEMPPQLLEIFKTTTLEETYRKFLNILSPHPPKEKINGVLKISSSLKTPFEWIPT